MKAEDSIQKALCRVLNRRGAPGMVYFHVPNGGSRGFIEAVRFKAMGVKAGIPDMVFIHEARAYFIELKKKGGATQKSQKPMHQALTSAGCPVSVCYGLDEAVTQLTEWGLLLEKPAPRIQVEYTF